TSSWAVSGFMQISTPTSRRRAMKPSLEARMVNQVGSPWMLEGKRFFPETGMPIWKIDRIRMVLEDWLPDPLAVATWIEKSLMTGDLRAASARCSSRTSVAMSLLWRVRPAELGMIPKRFAAFPDPAPVECAAGRDPNAPFDSVRVCLADGLRNLPRARGRRGETAAIRGDGQARPPGRLLRVPGRRPRRLRGRH